MSAKYTGFYRSPDDISNFRIRIKLKIEESDTSHDFKKQTEWHVKEFSWQEKQFSAIERQYYAEMNNCVTDLEKIYNEKIKGGQSDDDSIFHTYLDTDGYIPEQERYEKQISNLQKLVEDVRLSDGNLASAYDEFDYKASILSSIEKKIIYRGLESMIILADLGEFIEDIWIKNEQLLCILKYDRISRVFSIHPDFTNLESYCKNLEGGRTIHYYIENCSPKIEESEEMRENETVKMVTEYKRSLIREIIPGKFFLPPKNRLFIYLFIEILSAKNFEYSDVYVQYRIDLPKHWTCADPNNLQGVTPTCLGTNDEGLIHFGHDFEVILEYDIQSLPEQSIPETPYIYFEIISKASWERYRTEGLAFTNLPVSSPGCHDFTLSCFRFDTKGPSGRLRRFFIGDSYNYKDVRWIGMPKVDSPITIFNKFGVNTIGTGQIDVRMNILHQSQAFLQEFKEGDGNNTHIYEKLNASSLIRSVNQVLKAFKIARRHMIEATKDIVEED